jgi:glycosyltransferase involved in cell wall biosynthesis
MQMRIAIVHDTLTEFGGAEQVLRSLLLLYPHAHIFTSLLNTETIEKIGICKKNIYALPIPQKFFAKHIVLFQALSPILWRYYDFTEYDVTISISGYMMSSLVKATKTVYIQYILCPPKNIIFEGKTHLQKIFPYQLYLKRYIKTAIQSTPHVVTLSRHMRDTLDTLFHVSSRIIYPPVRIGRKIANYKEGKYFLIISRIDRNKSLELAIHACNALNQQLIIIGQTNEPAYLRELQSISGPNITFLGYIPDKQKEHYYLHAKAFIFTAKDEDFGIAPIEAMSYGLPVISYHGGALKETIINHKTGIFYNEHTLDSLKHAIDLFPTISFNSAYIRLHAQKYSEQRFLKEFDKYVNDIVKR